MHALSASLRFHATWVLALLLMPATDALAEEVLFDFSPGFRVDAIEARDAKVSVTKDGEQSVLRIATGREDVCGLGVDEQHRVVLEDRILELILLLPIKSGTSVL